MKKWLVKAVTQKALSLMPFGRQINHLLQQKITGGLQLNTAYLTGRLEHMRHHLSMYDRFGPGNVPKRCFEIGSGWHPVAPLALFLAGAEEIVTLDIRPHFTADAVRETMIFFCDHLKNETVQQYIHCDPERIKTLEKILQQKSLPLHEMLGQTGIRYITGKTAKKNIPANHFDFLFSNNTLQHISEKELKTVLQMFHESSVAEAIHSHFIDLTYEMHHFDPRLSVYHFMTFTPRKWRMLNNSLVPQNRLRLDDYRRLFHHAGFQIVNEQNRPGSVEELLQLKLQPGFKEKDPELNAVTHTYITAKK